MQRLHFHYPNAEKDFIPSKPDTDQKTTAKERIAVHAFDFDGCLFHQGTTSSTIIKRNQNLFKYIANEINLDNFSDVYIMSASSRQDNEHDELNGKMNSNGSSFRTLEPICEEISTLAKFNCTFDATLMSDIYNGKKAGESYLNAINSDYKGDHNKFLFDQHKISIIYIQMHKVASENPTAEITYKFYDDNYPIFTTLANFFKKNPTLIPNNVKLFINEYDGTQVTTFGHVNDYDRKDEKNLKDPNIIQGTGPIDFNYRKSILEIASQRADNRDLKKATTLKNVEHMDVSSFEVIRSTYNDKKPESYNKDDGKFKSKQCFRDNKFTPLDTGNLITDAKIINDCRITPLIDDLQKLKKTEEERLQTTCCLFLSNEKGNISAVDTLVSPQKKYSTSDMLLFKKSPALNSVLNKHRDKLHLMGNFLSQEEQYLKTYP